MPSHQPAVPSALPLGKSELFGGGVMKEFEKQNNRGGSGEGAEQREGGR